MKHSDFNNPIILDCDFCEVIEHFLNRHAPIDEGWSWMEQGMEDGTQILTVACPKHDADKVSEKAEEKKQSINYTSDKNHSKKAREHSEQETLGAA